MTIFLHNFQNQNSNQCADWDAMITVCNQDPDWDPERNLVKILNELHKFREM